MLLVGIRILMYRYFDVKHFDKLSVTASFIIHFHPPAGGRDANFQISIRQPVDSASLRILFNNSWINVKSPSELKSYFCSIEHYLNRSAAWFHLEDEYAERKKLYEQEEARYRKICRLFTWMRLIAFIGIVVNVYLALSSASAVPGAIMSAVFLVLIFVLRNAHFNRKRDYYSTLVQLTDKEIRILQFDFYDFPGGTQYLEMNHAYASDLDMFGAGSAYQYLNRTVTHMGQHQFVDILLNPELNP